MFVRRESNLAEIAKRAGDLFEMHSDLFAVIVDYSSPVISEESGNYVTQLKVIDPSFNFKTQAKDTHLRFFKFAKINLYAKKQDDIPAVFQLGDIIRLKRFKFAIGDKKGDLIAFDHDIYGKWTLYSGEDDTQKSLKPKLNKISTNPEEKGKDFITNRIRDLKIWAKEFFSKYSLKYILWWTDIEELIRREGSISRYSKVDLILKVTSADSAKKEVKLVDLKENVYTWKVNQQMKHLLQKVIKFRCTDVIFDGKNRNQRKIEFTKDSSFITVPSTFHDFQTFNLISKGADYDELYLSEFTDRSKDSITQIKKIHEKISASKIEKLNEILKNPLSHLNEKFLVEGKIVGFNSTDINSIIKKQFPRSSKVIPFDQKIEDERFYIVYHLQITLSDPSNKNKIDFHLVTSDDNYYAFDEWKLLPLTKNTDEWIQLKKKDLEKFSSTLTDIAKKNKPARFVLQLLRTDSGKPFFKVIDTIFSKL